MDPVYRVARWFGYNAPFIDVNGRVLPRQEDERLVKNDLLQLLLTVPGERIMSPDFGVNLRNAPFEPADAVMVGDLQLEIDRKIRANDRRVILKNVQVTATPDANAAKVVVVAALIATPNRDFTIEVKIPLGGAVATAPQQA
jgi:phage baseplate assembly protein W